MSSQNRTPSPASTLTDLSDSIGDLGDKSMSSVMSNVSVTSDDFKQKVDALIENKALKIEPLESRARALIGDLEKSEEFNSSPYGDSELRKEIKLHRILEAMLDFAFFCGKDNGKRYAACAICACSDGNGYKIPGYEDADPNTIKLAYLQDLSTTWLSHLLFVFKVNSSHRFQPNSTPSDIATPTLNDTAGHLDEGAHRERSSHFRANLLVRDGYRCVVTGRYDTEHPQVPEDQDGEQVDLIASHIFRRAIAVFKGTNTNTKSDEYLSALTTFDILRNYADMPIKSIEDIAHVIDHSSNGLTLQQDAHTGFDKFRWSLKETETPNEYTTVIYEKGHGLSKLGGGKTVTFTDHSHDFEEPSSPPRKKLRSAIRGSDLPSPLFIRIHCAIAGVLHMSGAGESIDRALDRAGDHPTAVILTGADFAYFGLAEDLQGAMSQVAVQ